jgi:hypothetical protein
MVAIRATIRAAIRAIGAKSEASFAFSARQLLFGVPLSLKILGYIFIDFVFLLYVQLTFVSFTLMHEQHLSLSSIFTLPHSFI